MIQTIKKHEKVYNFHNQFEIDLEDDLINNVDMELISYCPNCYHDYETVKEVKTYLEKGRCLNCNSENPLKEYYRKAKYVAGAFFNPVLAAGVTSHIRCKLYEDSLRYKDNVIMYATDSITFDKKVSHLRISDKLGAYEKTDKLHYKKKKIKNLTRS